MRDESDLQRGSSFVEVLMVAGIMAFMAMGVASMLHGQQQQIRALYQQQEIVDLKNLMLQHLAIPSVCSWQLVNQVIDVSMATTEAAPSPTVINLAEIRQGHDSTGALIAKAGARLPASLNGINVLAVSFKNIYATGNPDEYRGVFEIALDQSSLSHPMKPVQVQQIVMTVPTDPPSGKRISACSGGALGGPIVCRENSRRTVPILPGSAGAAAGFFTVTFAASECGGVLPNSDYVGVFAKAEVCGEDESWMVIQPSETSGPGAKFFWKGLCPSPGSADDIQVVFVHH